MSNRMESSDIQNVYPPDISESKNVEMEAMLNSLWTPHPTDEKLIIGSYPIERVPMDCRDDFTISCPKDIRNALIRLQNQLHRKYSKMVATQAEAMEAALDFKRMIEP